MTRLLESIKEDYARFRACFPAIAERQSAALLILFGFWLLLPWHTFNIETYQFLRMYMQEETLGIIMFLTGLLHMYGLVCSTSIFPKYCKTGYLVRKITLIVEIILWAGSSITAFIGYPPSLASVVYFWLFLGSRQAFFALNYTSDTIKVRWNRSSNSLKITL